MAIGQEVFGILPGLGMYATLWLREHNRVCDILKAEHPTWDDEQLFQTARLIVIGELAFWKGKLDLLEELDEPVPCFSSKAAVDPFALSQNLNRGKRLFSHHR